MNIVTLARIEDGKPFQGFIDWDAMERKVNFYYFDADRSEWASERLGKFRPIPESAANEAEKPVVIGG